MKNGKTVDEDGTERWYLDGRYHRDGGPAEIWVGGGECWYQYGKYHRDGGPAITYANGTEYWYQNGQIHRDDGPAATYADGTELWYQHGKQLTEEEIAILKDSLEFDSLIKEMCGA